MLLNTKHGCFCYCQTFKIVKKVIGLNLSEFDECLTNSIQYSVTSVSMLASSWPEKYMQVNYCNRRNSSQKCLFCCFSLFPSLFFFFFLNILLMCVWHLQILKALLFSNVLGHNSRLAADKVRGLPGVVSWRNKTASVYGDRQAKISFLNIMEDCYQTQSIKIITLCKIILWW